MNTASQSVGRARLLGLAKAVLLLLLFGLGAALTILVVSGGRAVLNETQLADRPDWLRPRFSTLDPTIARVEDSGLYPAVAANQNSPNVAHRFGAAALRGILRAAPILRNNLGALSTILAAFLGGCLLLAGVEALRRKSVAGASNEAAFALRKYIHRHVYRLGLSSLPNQGVGPVLNLFTREVNDVREGLAAELDALPFLPTLAAGLALIAVGVSWTAALFLGALVALTRILARSLEVRHEAVANALARESAIHLTLLHEDLGLLRLVRVHGVEDMDGLRFDEHLERHKAAEISKSVASAGSTSAALLVRASAVLGLGLLAHASVINGYSPAMILAILGCCAGLYLVFERYDRYRMTLKQAKRSAAAVQEYLDRKPELGQVPGAEYLAPAKGSIRFENVSLDNAAGKPLLQGLTVEIPAGKKVAIVSDDDASKYAAACLIPRLIDPHAGSVRVDGKDLRDVTLASLRSQISTVFQADLVFSDSVFANIGLGDPSYDMSRVVEAAKIAHAHQFIQELPQTYDTIIGPLGQYLSADRRYRVALARAYLHAPDVLIIEEPDAVFPADVASLLDDSLERLAGGRTMVILPRKLSTIRGCDQVIVLREGRLEVSGPPDWVWEKSAFFRHLQYVEFNALAKGGLDAGRIPSTAASK